MNSGDPGVEPLLGEIRVVATGSQHEEDGRTVNPESGRPQGGVISPVLAKFNLELASEKSAMVQFNRWEPDTSGKFTFLGFDFYWARTRRNPKYAVVKLRTTSKKPSAFLEAAPTSDRLPITSIALALANHSSLKCLFDSCPTLYLRVHPRSPVR